MSPNPERATSSAREPVDPDIQTALRQGAQSIRLVRSRQTTPPPGVGQACWEQFVALPDAIQAVHLCVVGETQAGGQQIPVPHRREVVSAVQSIRSFPRESLEFFHRSARDLAFRLSLQLRLLRLSSVPPFPVDLRFSDDLI